VEVTDPKLRRCLTGLRLPRRVEGVWRRGKYIVFALDRGFLVFHLRMTGQLVLGEEPAEGARAVFRLEGWVLSFLDRRRLATAEYMEALDLELGPEPLGDLSWLPAALRQSRRPIKLWLLDQRKIAGIGNIYVAEILFAAGIDPRRPAKSLRPEEVQRLVRAIPTILKRALEHRGTTFSDYRDAAGAPGEFQELLQVYQRAGEPCPRCGASVQRIELGGRGTYFCSRCQK
jgi:formamidopyrimidine-DNA glycosylase